MELGTCFLEPEDGTVERQKGEPCRGKRESSECPDRCQDKSEQEQDAKRADELQGQEVKTQPVKQRRRKVDAEIALVKKLYPSDLGEMHSRERAAEEEAEKVQMVGVLLGKEEPMKPPPRQTWEYHARGILGSSHRTL
jgi:hypothetical protein